MSQELKTADGLDLIQNPLTFYELLNPEGGESVESIDVEVIDEPHKFPIKGLFALVVAAPKHEVGAKYAAGTCKCPEGFEPSLGMFLRLTKPTSGSSYYTLAPVPEQPVEAEAEAAA